MNKTSSSVKPIKEYLHESILEKNMNNFNLVRLLAALIVIYSHSYAISSSAGSGELITRLTGVTHAGELSVVIFFFISGALVTKSLVASTNVTNYLIKRGFRIYPALIVCSFFVTYLLSWIFGGTSANDIIKNPQAFNYFLTNSLGVWNEHFIPGVFEDHPDKSLNGSLWSVTLELRLYLFLGLLAVIGLMSTTVLRLISMIGILIALGINAKLVPLLGTTHTLYGNESHPGFSSIFIIGGLFYLVERHIKINTLIALFIFGILMIIAKNSELYRFSIFAFTIVFSLWIATRKFLIYSINIRHDYSYGTYLYGWPALQISFSLLSKINADSPAYLTALAIPISLILAAFSWHFIEKPFIGLAQKLTSRNAQSAAVINSSL